MTRLAVYDVAETHAEARTVKNAVLWLRWGKTLPRDLWDRYAPGTQARIYFGLQAAGLLVLVGDDTVRAVAETRN